MSNIQAKDGTDALVPLATHLIGGEHHGAYLPSDPGTGAPFKAADDATVVDVRTAIGAQADAAATTDTGAFSLVAFIKRALQNWTTLLARTPVLGQAAMSASSPVTIASDQGPVPVNEPALLLTGAAAQTAVVNNVLSDPSGTAATDVANYRTMSVQVVSTGTAGTFIFEQSNDNVNFRPLPVFNAELVTGVPITAAITATVSQIIYTFPVRARFVRLRIATTITGGSIRAFARVSTEPWTAAAQLVASNTAGNMLVNLGTNTPALAASTNRAGFLAGSGIWYDDTSTALGAAATFSGTSRDATLTGTATAFANAATYAAEIVLSAEQDVTFTLALEVSRDNTAWRRVKAVPSAAVTGGGQYAEIVHRPSWRYWRLVVVNGAGAAARTTAGSIAKAI